MILGCSSYLSRALKFAPQQALLRIGMCISMEPTFPPLRKQFENFVPGEVDLRRPDEPCFKNRKTIPGTQSELRTSSPFIQERSRKHNKRISVSKIEALQSKGTLANQFKHIDLNIRNYRSFQLAGFVEQQELASGTACMGYKFNFPCRKWEDNREGESKTSTRRLAYAERKAVQ
ncbi:hypothetical protein PGTUg99_028262 [Puccinia graminis f. sp. tritici]|uniref:Uncharacterized protein n=1 Tax=Puccinia graminis f. sp. tritici TaxID=56615 RepID=A0A5B0NH21_PUCGR|nr:hypothetical protein PGTUg99_028262 [Puccinia graminis f. sp. tritici]